MFEDGYLPEIKKDPVLLQIYEQAIKPFESQVTLKNLTQVLSDSDFAHLMDFLMRRMRSRLSAFPDHRILDTTETLFLIDLTRPAFQTLFYAWGRCEGSAFIEDNQKYLRYWKRIWDGWMFDVLWECIAYRALKDGQKGDFLVAEETFPPVGKTSFRRMVDHCPSLREFFVLRISQAAKESLAVEIVRSRVLSSSPVDSAIALQGEQALQKKYPPAPYAYFRLGAEVIHWLVLYLQKSKSSPERNEQFGQLYFILDRQLRSMQRFDERHHCQESGHYHEFRNQVFGKILERSRKGIAKKFENNYLAWFLVETKDIEQQVDLAALNAIDLFDPTRTEAPFAALNKMIDYKAFTELRKGQTWSKRLDFAKGPYKEDPGYVAPLVVTLEHSDSAAPLSPGIKKGLRSWLTEAESEVLAAKCNEEADESIARKLGLSESRVRGLSVRAKKKLREKHPTPELLLLTLGF